MSHTATIKTQVKDPEAVKATCKRLSLPMPEHNKHRLYDGTEITGLGVQLPDWVYPVVFDAAGNAHYDNFNGRWGEQQHLDRFVQNYAAVKATMEARSKYRGCNVAETAMPDGSIRLRITGVAL